MVLRFEVNQAEAFRRGVNVPKSIVHLDVDPSTLSQEDRDFIADRLNGIDVHELRVSTYAGMYPGVGELAPGVTYKAADKDGEPIRIQAYLHSWEELLAAAKRNDADVRRAITEVRSGF